MSGCSSTTWRTRSSGRPQRAAGPGLRGVVGVVLEARARAGGEVDQHVGAARPDALAPPRDRARRPCSAWWSCGLRTWICTIAAPALAASIAGCGDLLRRHRHRRVLPGVVGRAGHRAGNDDLALHGRHLPRERCVLHSELYSEYAAQAQWLGTQALVAGRSAPDCWSQPGRGAGDLPPIVRCAKPAAIRVLGTNPNCDRGDFCGLRRHLAAAGVEDGFPIGAGASEVRVADERAAAGLSAAGRVHRGRARSSRWRCWSRRSWSPTSSPIPRSCRPTNAASTPSTTRA